MHRIGCLALGVTNLESLSGEKKRKLAYVNSLEKNEQAIDFIKTTLKQKERKLEHKCEQLIF